jgi:hypothetical protein
MVVGKILEPAADDIGSSFITQNNGYRHVLTMPDEQVPEELCRWLNRAV